jgi:hypothetical protein
MMLLPLCAHQIEITYENRLLTKPISGLNSTRTHRKLTSHDGSRAWAIRSSALPGRRSLPQRRDGWCCASRGLHRVLPCSWSWAGWANDAHARHFQSRPVTRPRPSSRPISSMRNRFRPATTSWRRRQIALSNISSNSSRRERRGTRLHAVVAARESVARNVRLCGGEPQGPRVALLLCRGGVAII